MSWLDSWRGRRHNARRVREALDLILDHKEPSAYGYMPEEEDAAIDEFNQRAERLGWGTRMCHPPRSRQPLSPEQADAIAKYLGIARVAN